ncbi:hypothetical protein L226DRAFT_530884 [Lentinus tigrinus ALCF2SS1-7]|uniref:Methyltransferase domain-containing protein n=1 Tax=Lentinus tigrinus ALCF2SS1-6 TaxID=1328759 RepID=A0A5C2SP05_9APHY|nr:hypothetical protein L227DRAFT_570865 [Lentinus tigrinus ALCF2SS1-6]RPD79046.1 hypothetical protein L226DRAFT_530884 [Lentinus tigrinus ALCF2SS1-7]
MSNPESEIPAEVVIPPLDPSLLTLTDEEKTFLKHAISSDEVEVQDRIIDVQKRAYDKYPYPCIRGFHFVNLFMARNEIYPSVVAAGKTGNTLFLDLGCMMGTDVRKLAYDGYPASHILGCDLREEYIELGYTLFRDKDTCPIRFFASNVFDLPTSPPNTEAEAGKSLDITTVADLSQLYDSLTHIYTGALFHLFDKESQFGLAIRLARLLKRQPGAVIFGRHQGLEQEGYIDDHLGRNRYGHSESSWSMLWKEVFTEVEGDSFTERIVVKARLTEGFSKNTFLASRRTHMLYWSVQIV